MKTCSGNVPLRLTKPKPVVAFLVWVACQRMRDACVNWPRCRSFPQKSCIHGPDWGLGDDLTDRMRGASLDGEALIAVSDGVQGTRTASGKAHDLPPNLRTLQRQPTMTKSVRQCRAFAAAGRQYVRDAMLRQVAIW